MEHDFIDKYAELDGVIQKLDPRVKIILSLLFIVSVILTQPTQHTRFPPYFFLMSAVILLSKIPLAVVLKRSLVIVPFILFAALSIHQNGFLFLFNIMAKSWLSFLCMIMLASTTRFPRLLKGFEYLKVPKVILLIISFLYRYVFVLMDEIMRMRRARDSRSFGGGVLWHIKTAGNMIGVLFIRAYGRSERVYSAMVSRGFTGDIKTLDTLKVGRLDVCFSAVFVSYIIMVSVLA